MERLETDVCVVGGGPVGLVTAMMLANAGVRVLVLERHENFHREYRGEVLQPLFSRLMHQLNLQEYLLQQPHLKLAKGQIWVKERQVAHVEFNTIAEEVPYALWMPQPILLQALYEKAKQLPNFTMWFEASIKELISEENSVVGLVAQKEKEQVEVRAKVTIGADGRFSTVRRLGKFEMEYEHYENDVIWFTIEKPDAYENTFRILISDMHTCILLPKYPDRVQVGIFMRKGEWKEQQEKGIAGFADELRRIDPLLHDFANGLIDFKVFTLLQSRIQYVKDWAQNGLLLIGDAAHCASPAGAVGISLGVETAVVAADVVYRALHEGDVSAERLREVQQIRQGKVRHLHQMQIRAEKTIGTSSAVLKKVMRYAIPIAAKTPLVKAVQKRILLAEKPFEASPVFAFAKGEKQ